MYRICIGIFSFFSKYLACSARGIKRAAIRPFNGLCQGIAVTMLLVLHVYAQDLSAPANFRVFTPLLVGQDGVTKTPIAADRNAKLRYGFSSGSPILLNDGRLMMVYCADDGEATVNKGEFRILFSTDLGRTWAGNQVIEKNPMPGIEHLRPAALQAGDGTIWVFYSSFLRYTGEPKTSAGDVWALRSTDNGKTWGGRLHLVHCYAGLLQGAIETTEGHLVLPYCYLIGKGRFGAAAMVSKDRGATWIRSETVDIGKQTDIEAREGPRKLNGGALEPSVVALGDGRLMMLVRTIVGEFWKSYSSNSGLSWSLPVPAGIDCGGTGYLTKLKSNRLALVWNRAIPSNIAEMGWPNGYESMWVALSDNDGENWYQPVEFARGIGKRVVHSLFVEAGDGRLLLTMPARAVMLETTEKQLLQMPLTNTLLHK